jgi:2-polyprenyl-3-methyl-5-hydroxy-6-metoxy-1,4-benzoquinol methylase
VYTDQNLYDAQYDIRQLKIRFRKILGLNEKKSDNAWRVKRIKELHRQYLKYSKTKKNIFKVLDVGAGTGVFLAKFLNTNYKGYALEINKVAARHLRDELRVKVYLGPVNKLKTRNRFDIVTLNKVLEHIKDSRTFLFLLRRFLTPKGIIYAEVPDTLNFKYYGNSSEAFCSGHYMVFSPESLFYLFKRAGYEVLDINRIFEPSGKITIYAFVTRKDNEIL